MDSIKEFTTVNGKNRHNISLLASEAQQINSRIDNLSKKHSADGSLVERSI
jgi:outer membrane murein-binding lipoprotein Lpp